MLWQRALAYYTAMISEKSSDWQRPSALTQHMRSVHALVLRDIKTRFGGSYFGFFMGLIIPLAHIGVVLALYIALGRRAPIGTDTAVYLATAVVPFVVWSYTHQKLMRSFLDNKSLLSFPVIKFVDIAVARSIVELMNSTLIVIVVLLSLELIGSDLFIENVPGAFFVIFLSYLLGVSTGLVFGCLSLLVPAVMVVGFVIIPTYWATSGVFFIPASLPEIAVSYLRIFPLAHIVDMLRQSVFGVYTTDFPSVVYVLAVIVGNILAFMAAAHFGKTLLTGK